MFLPTHTAFVCGATGTLGGAVARQLLALGWSVRAISRNIESEAAKALIASGADMKTGDYSQLDILEQQISGCQAIFINTCPTPDDFARELALAKNIIDVAGRAGVQHVLYSGGVQIQAKEGFISKVQNSKLDIEEATRTSGLRYWTVIRPAIFMANYLVPKIRMYPGATETGVFKLAVDPDTVMPLIDHEDVAKVVVTAFFFPNEFHGRKLDLAGEYLTSDQLLSTLSEASGKQIKGDYHSEEQVISSQDTNAFFVAQLHLKKMARLMNQHDAKSCPTVMTRFADFLRREQLAVNQTYQAVSAQA